jgi:DNA-binding protein Fis
MLARRRTKPDGQNSKPLRMLVVNTSPQLRLAFPEDEGGITVTQKRLAQVPPPDGDGYGLIVAETPTEWEHDGGRLRRLIETKSKCYVILAPAPLLHQTAAEIRAVGQALRAGLRRRGTEHLPPRPEDTPDGSFLHGALQRKLSQFVKAYSESGGRSLYSVVMREFERPLLEFALAQTGGNQRRTAELLGMNRNTLRKRMQECRLLHKTPTARRRPR